MKCPLLPALLTFALFAGCATKPPTGASDVKVFYATTRKIVNGGMPGKDDLDKSFGNAESTMTKTGGINLRNVPRLGIATVSVPKHPDAKTIGSETDVHIVGYDPALSTKAKYEGMASNQFYDGVHNLENSKQPPVVYVHGFNNDFEDAAHRAAVFARDLQPAVSTSAVIYSWPSAATVFGPIADYPGDEESALLDQEAFRGFLGNLYGQINAKRTTPVLLIGHSLGCRVITYGLRDWWLFRAAARQIDYKRPMFANLVLIEPDVNEIYFCQNIDRLRALCGRITIYFNGRDEALDLSAYLHDHRKRLGQVAVEYLTHKQNVDMVDASALPSDFFHHSYDDAAFFADLRLLAQGIPAKDRVNKTLGKPNQIGAYTFSK